MTQRRKLGHPRHRVKAQAERLDAVPIAVKVDRKARFRAFCIAHGSNPVELLGKLVFQDGWSHSATDYDGPDWPPPVDADERRKLALVYWQERLKIVRQERKELGDWIRSNAEVVQSDPSLTMPVEMAVRNAEGKLELGEGTPLRMVVLGADGKRRTVDFDHKMFAERMDWLGADVEECKAKIAELTTEAKE